MHRAPRGVYFADTDTTAETFAMHRTCMLSLWEDPKVDSDAGDQTLGESFTFELRGVLYGQGGYSTGFFEIGCWIGSGEFWTRKLVQTISKTYFGWPRDRSQVGIEQVF